MAIAVGAIRAGYHAFVRRAFDLAQDFAEAGAAGERRDFVQRLTRVDLRAIVSTSDQYVCRMPSLSR